MKKFVLLLTALLCIVSSSFAQSPQAFKYQAIARDQNGNALVNQQVSIRISIRQNSAEGTIAYQEIHRKLSNAQGLINLNIGEGIIEIGQFNKIDWSKGPFYVQIEMDTAGENNFINFGTSQLLSVPYALYAKESGNAIWKKDFYNNAYFNDGNIGIGTNYPETKLHLKSESNSVIRVQSDYGQGGIQLISGDYRMPFISFGAFGVAGSEGTVHFDVNNGRLVMRAYHSSVAEKEMSLMRSGNLGLGNSNPQFKLDVVGDINLTGNIYRNGMPIDTTQVWHKSDSIAYVTNVSVGIGTESPTARLEVKNGDIYINDINSGIILKSPNNKCWRVTIDDEGNFVRTEIDCPDLEQDESGNNPI